MPDKQFLDYEGLKKYHQKSKKLVGSIDISEDTKELYGVSENTTSDDLFQFIYHAALANARLVRVFVVNEENMPIPGVYINVNKSSGNLKDVKTNESGSYIFSMNANETATISVPTDIVDLTGSASVVSPSNSITEVTMTCKHANYYSTTSSKSIRISAETKSIDVSLCAGGGGGSGTNSDTASGSGGGGGYILNSFGISFVPYEKYSLSVGGGGSAGVMGNGSTGVSPTNGKSGGESSAFGLSANGGGGGYISGKSCIGGAGNGNGANGVLVASNDPANGNPGNPSYDSVFSGYETSIPAGGGGGSGGYLTWSGGAAITQTASGGQGGYPNGGAGAARVFSNDNRPSSINASNGTTYGGGGGGASGGSHRISASGSGAAGIISIRMHLT